MEKLDEHMVGDEITQKIFGFLSDIGLTVRKETIREDTFLPGIKIERGALVVDESKLAYPGDLLHEAGHIALIPASERESLNGNVEEGTQDAQSLEIGVILWSWAALCFLNFDPAVVFHEDGYRGASDWHINNFKSGTYIGLPLLQWMGLCNGKGDTNAGLAPFPHMIKWLRD